MNTEADTCREYVVPKLMDAGWDTEPHSIAEQRTFTDGRILVSGASASRRKGKRADYLLNYTRDFTLAVVEAKREHKHPADGLQQAKEYAEILGLKFAYATNGTGIVEFDYLTGQERELDRFPSPEDLWGRLQGHARLSDDAAERLLAPFASGGKRPRYYQEIAINRAVQVILQGQRRALLTMATGTGKTAVAFQICWKLWSSGWNRVGAPRRPRTLYLVDRNVLVDDPYSKDFAAFGDARFKIEGGQTSKGREMYFALYQALAAPGRDGGPVYKQYARDFFDLVIVDECHRGSASEESNWREILDYFAPAYHLGMTATPKRDDNVDTYAYFGNPIYTYSLKQGIDDGFLAPYRVHRVVTSVDATGWRPAPGEVDRYQRAIPDEEYHTKDFERVVALRRRTEAIARHLTDFLRTTDRFAKTIVFCVDQEHADEMRRAINNLNADLAQQYPDYVCRVTAIEGDIGRGHLSNFQDLERRTPVILTTSQLLTTGVDAQTCRNIAIARVVGSMTEFKQIIGRGTRVREDYGKLFFTILDYTGSATRLFADPDFNGEPALLTEEEIDEWGRRIRIEYPSLDEAPRDEQDNRQFAEPKDNLRTRSEDATPRKYYVDGVPVQIVHQLVYELDAEGRQINVTHFTDFTAKQVRTLYRTTEEMRALWADATRRNEIMQQLAERGITIERLAEAAGKPDADPFDLLCHIAFDAPLLTRRERTEKLRRDKPDFFDQYGPQARAVLNDLLDKYTAHGTAQFAIPDALKLPPISDRGNISEIAGYFGGAEKLRAAVDELQHVLYAS